MTSPSRPASPPAPAAESTSTKDVDPLNKSEEAEGTTSNPEDGGSREGSEEEESKEEKEKDSAPSSSAEPPSQTTEWQAVWAPTYNAYYYFNPRTNETTWTNPLAPTDSVSESDHAGASTSTAAAAQQPSASSSTGDVTTPISAPLPNPAVLNGIDPSLAYLDPSLSNPLNPSGAYTYAAKFNARTGTFARNDARDPSHLSEYERAKRMSDVYFDVSAWEEDINARNAAEADEEGSSKKRKKPSKADLVSLVTAVHFRFLTLPSCRSASKNKKSGKSSTKMHGCETDFLHVFVL